MYALSDIITDQPLNEGMARVKATMQHDVQLQRLSEEFLHILYELDDREAFLWLEREKQAFLTERLGADAACFLACVFDKGFDRLQERYRERKIPESVLADTLTDIDRRASNHFIMTGHGGIDSYQWLWWHMTGRLFQIGRLQFLMPHVFEVPAYVLKQQHTGELQVVAAGDTGVTEDGFLTEDTPAFVTKFLQNADGILAHPVNRAGDILSQAAWFPSVDYHCVLAPGDAVIEVHIPAGGKMPAADCDAAMRRAIEFAKRYFPEYDYRAFFICSWFLDEAVEALLDGSSNIVQFARQFTRTVWYRGANPRIYQWLFGFDKQMQDYRTHRAATTLQQGAHRLLQEGRWFTERTGIRLIDGNQ